MRPRTTNLEPQACDACQPTFDSAGALGLETNTQGLPSHGSLYCLRWPSSHALAFTLALPEVSYENANR
jgi:hypothetical protein